MVTPCSEGYSIRNADGKLLLKKFENALDWSLDTKKLQEEYIKKFRRKDFYFLVAGKKYTQAVINVKFNYAYKEFNNAGKNTYVRAGYSFRDCEMHDGVCVKDGKLIAIQTNIDIVNPLPQEVLGKYFAYADGYYKQVNTIQVKMNKSDLRQYLYEHGFVCDGIKYVRYKRSSGSSRVGKCLFVNADLAKRMAKWDACGLKMKENAPIDLAAWEAYISLPMSSIIDTVEIRPENILVVEDYYSKFEDDVIAVESQSGKLVAQKKRMKIRNNIWDGESLLDYSMFGIYASKGMLLLRNRFFKTCAFNANIGLWFKENGITEISQLCGFTLAKDISQIKLITTPSSIKYLKFGTLEDWLKNIDTSFGIVKYEKETHFFDGRMVQSHYQLLNTLQLSYQEMEKLLSPSLEYISAVRRDPDILRYHIKYPFCSGEDELNPLKSKNEIVFKMLGINNQFAKTKLYLDFRNDLVKGYIRNLKQGHILLHGNYSTLLGNGLELLEQAIGKFEGESVLKNNCIYSRKFESDKTILISRSPHITMGNILLAKNTWNEAIARYFNLTKEIVYVNAIGENIQQRLNGCDYDSDSVMLTDNEILIAAAKRNYSEFPVPTCFVESQKTSRFYNDSHKADLDIRTSVNKIGEIVNLSQQLNSYYWEMRSETGSSKFNEELYLDICKLAVLSGIEIDKAKKEYQINSTKEISSLKNKYRIEEDGKTVKPMFFKMITLENGYVLNAGTHYKYFKTSMDYLQKIVASANYRQARKYKEDTIPFMDIVKKPTSQVRNGYNSKQRDKIISLVRAAKEDIRRLYIDYDLKQKEEREQIRLQATERKQECVNAIDKMSECEYTMYLILKELDKKEYSDISRFVFEVLFGKPNEAFFRMLRTSCEPLYVLEESVKGDIRLYDFCFEKVEISAESA